MTEVTPKLDSKRSRTKVKTGCITCRIRRIKCDEAKPSCLKCGTTGRTCDGYESRFRLTKPDIRTLATEAQITEQDIQILNRYISTKTVFSDVEMDCGEDVRRIREASISNPSISHALKLLRALRQDFETNQPVYISKDDPSYIQGVEHYNKALRETSSSGPNSITTTLLCCQIFISIEQLRGNFGAMIQHMIGGLQIMYDHRKKPNTRFEQIPLLDVFVVKLFVTPCKFSEGSKGQGAEVNPHILSDVRSGLENIAFSTMDLLKSQALTGPRAYNEKTKYEQSGLMQSLELWLAGFELVHIGKNGTESVHSTFMRIFHSVLKVVTLGALDNGISKSADLKQEMVYLQGLANHVEQKIKTRGEKSH